MKTIFGRLLKISNEYKETIDDLSQDHDLESRHDFQLRDEIKAERMTERNTRFNGLIDRAAEEARVAAELEISKLRGAMRKYITSSDDAGTIAAVQALVVGGVELSDAEAAAFSEKGGFVTQKLLEQYTGGKIKALSTGSLDADLQALETYFKDIVCYRGGLASISRNTPWGQPPAVGSKIQEGRIEHFPEKMGEMQARWAVLVR